MHSVTKDILLILLHGTILPQYIVVFFLLVASTSAVRQRP